MRTILHSDCNSFYASVEAADDPRLRGKPVAVCGDPALRHGIVLAKSQEAKIHGVLTGEAVWEAQRKCPGLILVPADHRKYALFARKMREIYRRYTPLVEPYGMDESWLDVSGHALSGEEIAARLRGSARKELGITLSVGVSFNKVFAKLGSDMRKPDATTVISPDNFKTKVWPLPASDLLYVGRATARRLSGLGIYTIGELALAPEKTLRRVLGKNGVSLRRMARGEDDSPVLWAETAEEIKSVGNSTTTPRDILNDEDAKAVIYLLGDSVAARLRDKGYACRTVSVWMRDTALASSVRQCRLPQASDLGGDISRAAFRLFQASYRWELPLRSLGVTGSDLVPEAACAQLPLWSDARRARERALEQALDGLRARRGQGCVRRGLMLQGGDITSLSPADDHALQPLAMMHGRG